MMKTTAWIAALAFTFSVYQQLNAQAIPLGEALKKGYLSFTATGNGGHTGESLKLKLVNKSKKQLTVLVAAGQVFEAGDSSLQNLMVAKEEMFMVEAGRTRTANLSGLCIEASDGSPGEGSGFSLGKMAEGNLLKMARYLSDNNLHTNPAAQFAVWAVSDAERLESIGDPALAKFTADMLGKPVPEYHIEYQQPQDRMLPGQPANWREAMALNGLFYYDLSHDTKVDFGLYNEQGELVHTLFKNRLQRRGSHKFRFNFEIRGLEKGKYFVRLTRDGQVLKELAAEF
ncbi:MAG: hypothetical protein H6577_00925 [Lewinellaceae bacterium]|nr:hypothetical protein [Saprospiraceae bacterium]MCB9336671.1 hypothetical protein [Lewinellaceae bacterium]